MTARTETPPLTEKAFQQQIIDLAKLRGWLVYHVFDSRRSNPGFPDLILIRGDTLQAFEVKTEKGRVSADQEAWLDAFGGVVVIDAEVVRPSDWDYIERVLR